MTYETQTKILISYHIIVQFWALYRVCYSRVRTLSDQILKLFFKKNCMFLADTSSLKNEKKVIKVMPPPILRKGIENKPSYRAENVTTFMRSSNERSISVCICWNTICFGRFKSCFLDWQWWHEEGKAVLLVGGLSLYVFLCKTFCTCVWVLWTDVFFMDLNKYWENPYTPGMASRQVVICLSLHLWAPLWLVV